MKIIPLSPAHHISGRAGMRPKDATSAPAASAHPDIAKQVRLSPAALHLAGLHNSSSDIDAARVQELREAIANGTLSMDPGKIADALLAVARGLLK